MLSTSTDGWQHAIDTIHYYDYNVPNVIEAPTEYTAIEIGSTSEIAIQVGDSQ